MDQQQSVPHRLSLEERHRLIVTGVSEVLQFEEDSALLRTPKGMLLVQGSGLQLRQLTPEGGQVAVEGTITALEYGELRKETGFLRRFFG